MKKLPYLILPLLAILLSLACQEKNQGPHLGLEQETVDLGVIDREGGKVSVTTTVKNGGKAPLLIRNIKSFCPCTTATLSSNSLKPGEEATLTITYSPEPDAQPGEFLRIIELSSNDPQNSKTTIFVEGVMGSE